MKKIAFKAISSIRNGIEYVNWTYLAIPIASPNIFSILRQICTDVCALFLAIIDISLGKVQTKLSE